MRTNTNRTKWEPPLQLEYSLHCENFSKEDKLKLRRWVLLDIIWCMIVCLHQEPTEFLTSFSFHLSSWSKNCEFLKIFLVDEEAKCKRLCMSIAIDPFQKTAWLTFCHCLFMLREEHQALTLKFFLKHNLLCFFWWIQIYKDPTCSNLLDMFVEWFFDSCTDTMKPTQMNAYWSIC